MNEQAAADLVVALNRINSTLRELTGAVTALIKQGKETHQYPRKMIYSTCSGCGHRLSEHREQVGCREVTVRHGQAIWCPCELGPDPACRSCGHPASKHYDGLGCEPVVTECPCDWNGAS